MINISTPWHFPGSDVGLRARLFAPEVFSHPAKMNLFLLQKIIDLYTAPGDTLYDPMAGTGSLMLAATQQRNVVLRELEPSYVELQYASLPIIHRRAGLLAGDIHIALGDARQHCAVCFDHIITSPPYGFETTTGFSNVQRAKRLAEVHGDKRRWMRFIDQPTHASFAAGFRYVGAQDNIGNKTGRNYWREMEQVYCNLVDLMPSGGLMILVLKNHYRRGVLRNIVGQTTAVVEGMGLTLIANHIRAIDNLSLWQRRRKERGEPVVEVEHVLIFRSFRES